jgi:hypothetical protein
VKATKKNTVPTESPTATCPKTLKAKPKPDVAKLKLRIFPLVSLVIIRMKVAKWIMTMRDFKDFFMNQGEWH